MTIKDRGIYAILPDRKVEWSQVHKVLSNSEVRTLQYRRKSIQPNKRLEEARALKRISRQHRVCFIINDDVELAKKVGADGLHLGKNDTSPERARALLGERVIVGISCYNDFDRALAMERIGVDYVALGAIFPSITKPRTKRCTLRKVKAYQQRLQIPIVGIGGVSMKKRALLYAAGCTQAAMISGLFGSP